MLKIYTSTVYGYKKQPDMLDISVKTAKEEGLPFVPNWDIVMGWKNGTVSKEEYVKTYVGMMRRSYTNNRSAWDRLLQKDVVTLLCFCHAGEFCHRYVLAAMLVLCGAEYIGEVISIDAFGVKQIDKSTCKIVDQFVVYLKTHKSA